MSIKFKRPDLAEILKRSGLESELARLNERKAFTLSLQKKLGSFKTVLS
jgi:hypothetical protein